MKEYIKGSKEDHTEIMQNIKPTYFCIGQYGEETKPNYRIQSQLSRSRGKNDILYKLYIIIIYREDII